MDVWNRLVSITYGVEVSQSKVLTQEYMLKEYEKVKHLRPKLKKNQDGRIFVSGLEVLAKQQTK